MSLVAHKYTPAEISEAELEATFAARGHTVDFLLKSLRDQVESGTLSSFVVLGPRGAGKSTVLRMVVLRMKQDAALNKAWLPVVFPEEQFEVTSLRDLFAATLENLAQQGMPGATGFSEKVAAETDDEQSLQVAITGLRTIARDQRKRLVLFLENLNLLLEDCFTDQEKGTLRRLLMTEPFLMVMGSAVHVFDALRRYDEAFFNYFAPVRLDRLDADQVFELLTLRAKFDGNQRFEEAFPQNRARIRAIVQLSGGNPRLMLMLYELLSQRQVTTIVDQLRRLVDELTPLLKDEMEGLAPQQRKIIHALMERGGTAQPADLVEPTRLSLGTITAQLRRLKEAQFVDLLGGGKGRRASYTIPDQLFVIWYQMRYLRKNRRRIELFVEVLRVWFEAEERTALLREMAAARETSTSEGMRETARMSEYLADSLKGTAYAAFARDLAIEQWLRCGEVKEAAGAYGDLCGLPPDDRAFGETNSYLGLGHWCIEHGDARNAIDSADRVLQASAAGIPTRATALAMRGFCRAIAGEVDGGTTDLTEAIGMSGVASGITASALILRATVRLLTGDLPGSGVDLNTAIETPDVAPHLMARGAALRCLTRAAAGDVDGAVADIERATQCSEVASMVLPASVASAMLILRLRGIESGVEKVLAGFAEYLAGLPETERIHALVAVLDKLALPGMSGLWNLVWRFLGRDQPPLSRDVLRPFAGVAAILKGADRSVLEPLPPEQREFAETVLKRFEPPAPTTAPSEVPEPPTR